MTELLLKYDCIFLTEWWLNVNVVSQPRSKTNFKHISWVTECLLNFTEKLPNIDWIVTAEFYWKVIECWLKITKCWLIKNTECWLKNYWMFTEKLPNVG